MDKFEPFIIKKDIDKDKKFTPSPNYKLEKELFEHFTNEFIFLRIRRASKTYKILTPLDAIKHLKKNFHYYEAICINQIRKLYIDIDSKEHFSYNDILTLTRDIINHIEFKYNIKNIKFNIYCSYEGKLQSKNPDDKIFTSTHIIFTNIATKTNLEAKQLIQDFLTEYKEYYQTDHYFNKWIDFKAYNKNQIFRQINQSKINTEKILKRIVKCPLQNNLTENTKVNLSDLITYIDESVNIINIEIEKNEIVEISNIEYYIEKNINTIERKMKSINYTDKDEWKMTLFKLLYSLYYINIRNEDSVINHKLVQDFLQNSFVEPYNTDEYRENNIRYISHLILTKKFLHNNNVKYYNELITTLDEEELEFISLKTNMNIENISFTYLYLNNKNFFIINDYWIYNINYKILLERYEFYKDDKTGRKKIKCDYEYNFNFGFIEKSYLDYKSYINNNTQSVEDLNDIIFTLHNNYYIKAPVGTGKTHICMRKILTQILLNTEENILIVADIITLTMKQKSDILEILNDLDIGDIVYHYKDLLKDARSKKIDKNKRIFITTYDSYKKIKQFIKFNYLIIDEFKNTLKRSIHIQNKELTNDDKSIHIKLLLSDCNNIKGLYFLDADIDKHIVEFLKRYITTPILFYSLEREKAHKIKIIQETEGITDITNTIFNLKKNIVIATTSQNWGVNIYNKIVTISNQLKQNIKIVLIDKNGATDNNKYQSVELKNNLVSNTDLWENYNVVIYTPTITTGISFNNPIYFYKSYIYLNKQSTDITQSTQFSYRVRNTETNDNIVLIKNIHNTLNYNNKYESLTDHNQYKLLLNDKIDSYELFKTDKKNDLSVILNELKCDLELNLTEEQQKLLNSKYIVKCGNNEFIHLRNYEALKEKEQQHYFLFYYILKNLEWGVKIKNISTHFFSPFLIENPTYNIENIEDEVEISQTITQMCKEDFINHNYVNNEIFTEMYKKYNNNVDDTDEYRDFLKTITLKKWGITEYFYERNKEYIHKNLTYYYSNEEKFKKASNIRYYHYKNAIYYIVDNMVIEKDYITELNKHNSVKIKYLYQKLYNLYVAFKILDILEISTMEGVKALFEIDCYFDKTEDLMKKLYDFIELNKNKIEYIKKVNRMRINKKNRYGELVNIIKNVLGYVGIENINFGREIPRTKNDKKIGVCIVNKYRIQLLDNNEDDDIEFYNNAEELHNKIDKMYKIKKIMCVNEFIEYGNKLLKKPHQLVLHDILNFIKHKDKLVIEENDYVDSENDEDM